MTDQKKAVVLLSGGLDSSTVLYIAREKGFALHALSFDYGQRHNVEQRAARVVAQAAGVQGHLFFNLADLGKLGHSSLTDECMHVPKGRNVNEMAQGFPTTYVPARNTIMLSIALAYCETIGARHIFHGMNAVDYSGYPDCRPEFIEAFERLANKATKQTVQGGHITIHTPLIHWTKATIIEEGARLGVPYGQTVSCYDPDANGYACGACDTCTLRRDGFINARVPDPTIYRKGADTTA